MKIVSRLIFAGIGVGLLGNAVGLSLTGILGLGLLAGAFIGAIQDGGQS